MKKYLIYLSILLNVVFIFSFIYTWYSQQNKFDYFNFVTTSHPTLNVEQWKANEERICFVGNSITANWYNLSPEFFEQHGFINRGVGGHSSSQILLRFRKDVLAYHPTIVVLNTGINDIAKSDGFYNQSFTLQNIQSMIDICKANNIELLLSSVLPATEIQLTRVTKMVDMQSTIIDLNKEILKLANKNGLKYINYHATLQNEDGTFNKDYNFDGVHPNRAGYEVMERIFLEALNSMPLFLLN